MSSKQRELTESTTKAFFCDYNAHNVTSMIKHFSNDGTIEYVPFDMNGPATDVGPASWGALIDAFPNLYCEVNDSKYSEDGKVAFLDVVISGTQVKDVFGVPNKGLSYSVRHYFIFECDEYGSVTHLTSFWDNATFFRQLGTLVLE